MLDAVYERIPDTADSMKNRIPGRYAGQHALICGGSRGIGFETARELLRRGAHVCLIARDPAVLESAAAQLRAQAGPAQYVDTIACDTTDADALRPLLDAHIARRGLPDLLINNVGYAYPQYLDRLRLADFRANMDANYYGQLVPTLLLLPPLRAAGRGHIAFVSSMLGYMGVMGYATYAPTKFALVGLAEVLRNELKPAGIAISVLYPPDTQTEGYVRENLSKPPETLRMSAAVKPMTAAAVARAFVDGLERRRYAILPGEAGMVWRVARFAPWLLRWMLDRAYAQARRRI